MEKINIQFTLFSAFYSPLIATLSGGFLKEEGLEGDWSVAAPGTFEFAPVKIIVRFFCSQEKTIHLVDLSKMSDVALHALIRKSLT